MVSIKQVDDENDSTTMEFDSSSDIWADVTPVPQNDGPSPLCPILYDPEYSQAMDLYRGLKQLHPSGVEASERALSLTEHLVHLNPANYSIWQYRAQVLIELNKIDQHSDRLLNELDFLDEFAKYNMKNYQIWQHRKIVVSILGDPSRELAFTKANLQLDMKNYHTWAYRQWVLAYFGGIYGSNEEESLLGVGQFPELWDGELDFAEEMIQKDIRNNSAYNHRWYCIFARYSRRTELDNATRAMREQEIQYALDKIAQAPHNASPWNYLRGLFTAIEPKKPLETLEESFHVYLSETDHRKAALSAELDANGRTVAYALEWLLDSKLEQLENLSNNHSQKQTCRYVRCINLSRSFKDYDMLIQRGRSIGNFERAQFNAHLIESMWSSGSSIEIPIMQGFNMGRYRPWDEDYRDKTFKPKKPREGPPKFGKVVRSAFSHLVVSGQAKTVFRAMSVLDKESDLMQRKSRMEAITPRQFGNLGASAHRNTRYIIESGAREQLQDWNPEEVGGHPIHDPDAINEDGAFSQLEKKQAKQKDNKQQQARIEELEDHATERWANPYERNAELRKTFRAQKKLRLERAGRDASLRERIGWSDDMALVGESSSDPQLSTPVLRQAFRKARSARPPKPVKPKSGLRRNTSRVPIMSDAARNLAGRMLAQTSAKR